MPDYRKPPVEKSSRGEPATAFDAIDFSIETTTMRLKSLKLRRAEAADRELDKQLRGPAPAEPSFAGGAGRVRHDERGQAVWDMAVATGEVAALSATHVMRKLNVSDLQLQETQREVKALQPARPAASSGDPYNTPARGSGDPYNTRGVQRAGDPTRRPPPGIPATPVEAPKPRSSVLEQLTGRKPPGQK